MQNSRFLGKPMDRVIAASIKAKRPVLLWGAPGIGKTSYINALGDMMNHYVETLLVSLRESSDFLGLPVYNGKDVDYKPGAWVNRVNNKGLSNAIETNNTGSLLFLDEITTADDTVMKGALRLVDEGWAGEAKLEDWVAIVLAANDPEHAVDGNDLPAPMANRILHLDFTLDAERWSQGLMFGWDTIQLPALSKLVYNDPVSRRATVASAVSKYVMRFDVGDALNPPVPEDPTEAGKAWASPRTWSFVVDVLSHIHPSDDPAIRLVVEGLVGAKHAAGFATFLKEADLIDPLAAIEGRSNVDWDELSLDRKYVACNAITSVALQDPVNRFEAAMNLLIDCAERKAPDVAQQGVQKLSSAGIRMSSTTAKRFNDAFSGLLSNTTYRVVDAV